MSKSQTKFIIVMGVSGCGKSTIGEAIATQLAVQFLDGDDFHPRANKEKMAQGTPLTDEDRWPWLSTLTNAMKKERVTNGICVAACSALKRSYRDHLRRELSEQTLFVHLEGTQQLIYGRMASRNHEYMPSSLLDSQFATLEPLQAEEFHLIQSIENTAEDIVKNILFSIGR